MEKKDRRRKDDLYKKILKEYNKGYSCGELGKMFGLSRQSIHQGLKARNAQFRRNKRLPFLMFNGEKFTLRNMGYYGRTSGDRRLMHIVVWEHYNGKIPPKHDIHHINHDKTDNRIENLELYTKSEHASKFNAGKNQYNGESQK